MNKKHVLLLSLLLSQTASVWAIPPEEGDNASSTTHQKLRQPPQEIAKASLSRLQEASDSAIKETKKRLARYNNSLEKVIVIGYSGSGKSALIHGLAGTAIAEDAEGELKLKSPIPNPLPDIVIGEGLGKHGTSLPGAWHDTRHNVVFWDSPGFGDPGVDGEDIINGTVIRELFSAGVKARLVLAIDEGVLFEHQPMNLQHLFNEVAAIFPDLNQLKQNLSVIVTKHFPHRNPLGKLEALQKKGTLEKLEKPGRDLFDFLVNVRQQRVAVLSAPMQEGPYNFDRDKILNVILDSTQSVLNPEVKTFLNDASKLLVADLAQKLNDGAQEFLKTEGTQRIIDYCQTKADRHTGLVGELRTSLGELVTTLQGLIQIPNTTPEIFAERLENILGPNPLRKTIQDISFLKEIKDDVTHQIASWAAALVPTINSLAYFIRAPQEIIENGILYLKGMLVGTSDLRAALGRQANQQVNEAIIHSSNTLFFDTNIEKPGGLLAMNAPHWNVTRATTIDLGGAGGNPGPDRGNGTGPDGCGEPGGPGEPGRNGGHFRGKLDTSSHLNQLTINVRGGQGGRGGNGGNGNRGQNGIVGNVDDLKNWRNVTLISRTNFDHWKAYGTFKVDGKPQNTHNYATDMSGTMAVYRHGSNGTPGKDGGNPGTGGLGGHAGSIVIEKREGANCNRISGAGGPGLTGTTGKGGSGGSNGPIWEGKYITNMSGIYKHRYRNIWGSYNADYPCTKDDHWQDPIQIAPQTYADSGRDGNEENANGLQQPYAMLSNETLNAISLAGLQEFKTFYLEEAANPLASPFVRVFPNL